ncbi:unnamed protein product, partial [Symbiodinium natans]
ALVSPPFNAAGLEELRLMVFPEGKETTKGPRSKRQRELYSKKVNEGPLEGCLKLKVPSCPPQLELHYFLKAEKRALRVPNLVNFTVSCSLPGWPHTLADRDGGHISLKNGGWRFPGWLQFATSFGFLAAFAWYSPSWAYAFLAWLAQKESAPVQNLPNPEGESGMGFLQHIALRPATSLSSVWDAYLFAGQFSTIPAALQILEFPQAFLDWRRLPNAPPPLDPEDLRALPGSEDDVVSACDEMMDSFGGVLLAVHENSPEDQLVGTLALRVKWLPDACHLCGEDGVERVVRTVPLASVLGGNGLEPVAYLEQFAVEWRGSGLAAHMLREVEERARSWGTRLLALHVQRDDWQPLRFYQKNGFEISSDWMGRGPQRFLLIKLL